MKDKVEPIELWYWDSTEYLKSTRRQVGPNPLNYNNEILQSSFYSTRWLLMQSLLKYDNDTLKTTPVLYTMTNRLSQKKYDLRLYRLSSNLHVDK